MAICNRRKFLLLTGAATSCVGLGVTSWLLRGGANSEDDDLATTADGLQAATRTSWALGADVSMTALHESRATAELALDDAFAELNLVERLMSIYQADSQLSRLNRDGVLTQPHPYFVEVLRAARKISQATDGAFDVTVQPLWALYVESQKSGRLPSADEVKQAQQAVDWRSVEIADDVVRLHGAGRAITLNGIAQGYAGDRATAALRARGVDHALVNTGEFGTIGRKENSEAWIIGIQHPRDKDAFVSVANLAGRCLATSGDYETTFSDDFRLNHLFDPRTGRSPSELASVSVVANTAMDADALSTAVFVLGANAGLRLIRATAGADALLVRKDATTLITDGFPVQV